MFLFLIRHLPAAFAVIIVLGLWLVPFFLLFPLLIVPVLLAIGGVPVGAAPLREERAGDHPSARGRAHSGSVRARRLRRDQPVHCVWAASSRTRFRRALFPVLMWPIDYFARHVFGRGHLGRIRTIHFARWVFLDGKKRMLFASNYDGSHEAYMDDFINKAGWGLNLAFNCGLGYPRTRWIIKDGIDEELKFKYTQRRHQTPTETWYRAYPGLTVFDIERNARVRAGFERRTMTDEEVRAWLADL